MAIITKQRKTYTVINYEIDDEGNKIQTREVFYDYQEALKRKNTIESHVVNKEINVTLNTEIINYLLDFCAIRGSQIWSSTKYEIMTRTTYNYLKPLFKKKKIKDVMSNNAQRLIYKLQKEPAIGGGYDPKHDPIPHSMIKQCLTLLRQSFDYLVFIKVIDNNPFHNVEITRKCSKNRVSPEWSMENVIELFNQCRNNKLYIFLHLYFALQLEITEVLALTWDNIQIDKENEKFSLVSNKILRRHNKVLLQNIDKKRIIQKFPNYSNVDSSSTLVLLKKDGTSKKINVPIYIAHLLLKWQKIQEERLTVNKYNLVLTLDNGRPYDFDNMRKNFKQLKHECQLEQYSLVKLRNFALKTNENGINNALSYYNCISLPLVIPHYTSKSNYRYHQVKKETKHIDLTSTLPNTKETLEVKNFIEMIKNDDELKKQLLLKLSAGQ